MSNSNSNGSSGGVGLSGVLFIVFLVLKLTDVIDWSWWWVTAPLWGPLALVLSVLVVIGIPIFLVKAALKNTGH
jgi:predicted Co/Zn/Cd cation transporter (cation efflux family)